MHVQGRELYVQSSQYMGSYAVTNAKADVHCENDALAGFICEVSCELTSPLHLYVCMCEGAVGYSQSVVQFSPNEWTLPTRLTV